MKPRMCVVYTLPFGVAILFGAVVMADEKSGTDKEKSTKPQENAGLSVEEMTKRWEAYATPGAKHKVLEPLVGEWTVEARYWMGGPGSEPMESKGTSKVQWILGGRYLREEFS